MKQEMMNKRGRQEREGAKKGRQKRGPGELMAEISGLYRDEKLGKGREAHELQLG